MKHLVKLASVCVLAIALRAAAADTVPAGMTDRVSFFAAALSELLSDSRAFTARAELQLPGTAPGQVIPFGMAMLDGRMRWQLNLEQIRGSYVPAEVFASLKQAQLDRVVMVAESEKPLRFGFPSMKAWLELPMPKAGPVQEQAQAKIGRLNKALVGRETVDGHPCQKYQLTLPPEMARGESAWVWTATDLKDLPVKLQVRLPDGDYTLAFRNVHQMRPDPRLFVAPPGYTRHASFESVLQAGLAKSLGDGNGANGPGALGLNLGRLLGTGLE